MASMKIFHRSLPWIGLLLLPLASIRGQELTIIAHRGNSSEAPENTLASFQSAAAYHFPYIECDVHLTKDGVPVVVHDRYLSRTINQKLQVAIDELTLTEVQSFDSGEWFHPFFKGEKIPTLKELLQAPLENIGLMIEIKEGTAPDAELVAAVLKEVDGIERPLVVGSFSANIVRLVKEGSAHLKTIGIAENQEELSAHLAIGPDIYALDKEMICSETVQSLHEKGKKVWVWTVDKPEDFTRVKSCNVDGVISNYPRLMR